MGETLGLAQRVKPLGWILEGGTWWAEPGGWNLEGGTWRVEPGGWNLEGFKLESLKVKPVDWVLGWSLVPILPEREGSVKMTSTLRQLILLKSLSKFY